ncbi:Nmad5 family putative nucleotide modification protein [Limnobaculum xujianqingii]|uniref:Nmad5 family putative nucleotide modification protein n=1 Tax=Limnobaculum xujianqingii TaxID=2738837 RepID=UPI0015C08A8C|nr:Nmad5 family putative nucleotide modification protein [Limnobaculum xujianqingii]
MSQVILTKDFKEQIIRNALTKAGIAQRKSALRAARVVWAERVRIAAIGGQDVENAVKAGLKKIEALANKFPEALRANDMPINIDTDIKLNLAGSRVYAYFNGNYTSYERNSPKHVSKITPKEFTLLADDPLVTEFYSFDALYKQISDEEDTIRQNVIAALDKVRTLKRLLEIWPEAKELLPESAPKAPLPPAIRREALNEMIGLPSD